MKTCHYYIVLMMILLIIFIGYCFADDFHDTNSFRCRGKVIVYGDTKFEVLKKCGSPTVRSRFDDWWIYNFGTSRFIHYIKFANHKVNLIEVSDYRGAINQERQSQTSPIKEYHRYVKMSPP